LSFFLSGLLFGGSVVGALLTQHFLDWQPCVMCVEIRAWLILASVLLLVASAIPLAVLSRAFGVAGLLASLGASYKGGQLFALEVKWVDSFSCSPFARFPSWMPLQEWFPYLFQPQAICGEDIRSLFFIPLSAWPLVLTVASVVICICAIRKKS
jgi:disulfide bond formation protein DsbB